MTTIPVEFAGGTCVFVHSMMRAPRFLLLFFSVMLSLAGSPFRTVEAQGADLAQLRARVQALGLTEEQLRERLKAANFDAGLFDSYLQPGRTPSAPTPEVMRALDVLRQGTRANTGPVDTTGAMRARGLDTVSMHIDSVPVFGLDVFRQATNRFDPLLAGPVDGGYRLGAGDVMVLILTGSVELSHSLEVTREGFVVVPQVGQVFVANMTLNEATELLRRRVGQSYSGVGTGEGASARLYTTVARLRTNQVFVLGEVAAPGSYQLSASGTMLTALYAAGGPTVAGSLRTVELRRAGRIVGTLDVYDYLLRGDASADLRLEQGDVLFVPQAGARVRAMGEVFRPAWYEAKSGERAADLIRAAGGFRPTAVQSRVVVTRVLPPTARVPGRDRAAFDVSGAQLAAFSLEDGDVLQAFPVTERVRGRVTVLGHVWTPGPQGLHEGMRFSEALTAAGGLKPGAYLDMIAIRRRRPDDSFERLAVRLNADGRPLEDVTLQEDDELTVYAREQFMPERYVTVGGAVRQSGRVAWTPGLTLRRALLEVGGLVESALLSEVEVSRMPTERRDGTLAVATRVPIDSSYLFERMPDGTYYGPPGIPGTTAGTAADYVLQPYDVVNVLHQPDFEYLGSVTIGGEVQFPGSYAITRKGERLQDLIQRAGGLTNDGDPNAAVFSRRVSAEQLAERQRLLTQMRRSAATSGTVAGVAGLPAAMNSDGVSGYLAAMDEYLALDSADVDRVNVDLAAILRDARSRTNFEVRPGDRLTVPRRNPTVTVKGFVQTPTTVAHEPGRRLSHYVSRSGGATAQADEHRAYVLQPNGAVESYRSRWWLIPDRDPVVREGALVVVPPRELGERPVTLTQVVGPITQVLASTVALLAIIFR